MNTNFILYGDNNIHLDSIKLILTEHYRNHEVLTVTDESQIIESLDVDSFLIFNISSFNTTDALTKVESFFEEIPRLKMLIISKNCYVELIRKMYCIGVKGFLDFSCSLDDFLAAVDLIYNDNVYINEQVKKVILLDAFNVDDANKPKNHHEELTKRESEVLHLICEGLTSKEIANQLYISVHTVESHKRNVMQKFDVRNCTSLIRYAYENNLVNII